MGSGFAVVDLFAGPGGLAEGFSAVRAKGGKKPFKIVLSVEMDGAAHSTLLLRSFLRQFNGQFPREYYAFLNGATAEPQWATLYPQQWKQAQHEALRLTLGEPAAESIMDARLTAIRNEYGGKTILIGGPPCQAYSLAGRARNQGKEGYVPENDHRHRLYEEYVRILVKLTPAAFVMENVKGMLSSSLDGSRIFERVLQDLRSAGGEDNYTLVALGQPAGKASKRSKGEPASADFIIRAEDFGLPQARHRVIVVGIRRDIYDSLDNDARASLQLTPQDQKTTVAHVLGGMPKLRSGLSSGEDSGTRWQETVLGALDALTGVEAAMSSVTAAKFRARVDSCRAGIKERGADLVRMQAKPVGDLSACPADLRKWLLDANLVVLANNQTRGHMSSDLARYLFAAIYGEVAGVSPKAGDYPASLAPKHVNWDTGKFADRFRVQLAKQPSTTITSHISKDGHYFIHYDPEQCRSLTVREAARLQTFPDNYFFKGNRTEQFIQVGNAVPPFLAFQIGEALNAALPKIAERKKPRKPRRLKNSLVTRRTSRNRFGSARSATKRYGLRMK